MYFSGWPKLTLLQERCLDSLTEDGAALLPHIRTPSMDYDLIFCCLLNTVEPEYDKGPWTPSRKMGQPSSHIYVPQGWITI